MYEHWRAYKSRREGKPSALAARQASTPTYNRAKNINSNAKLNDGGPEVVVTTVQPTNAALPSTTNSRMDLTVVMPQANQMNDTEATKVNILVG